jgi:hypothetical protein
MTLLVCILGGLGCAVIGALAGYRYCAHVNGCIFQAFYDNGTIIVETVDGWDGTKDAWKSVAKWLEKKCD